MSEIEERKQRPEVDETKRQQDEEKIRNEGGPRLNGRLAVTAVGLMVGLVILLTCSHSSVTTNPFTRFGSRFHTRRPSSRRFVPKCA